VEAQDNYIELVSRYYHEELRLLKTRPGWMYVKDKQGAYGQAYEKAQRRAREDLTVNS